MKFNKTKIEGVYDIELEPRIDERGYFVRNFCQKELSEAGIDYNIVQINRSSTKKAGTIRGLHFQRAPKEESKIFQCLKGAIFYVTVDLRPDSPTHGEWFGLELSEEDQQMIVIPKGCASGFQTLVDNTEVQYWSSEFYSGEHEGGVRFDDPSINIAWPMEAVFVSEKDKSWPLRFA